MLLFDIFNIQEQNIAAHMHYGILVIYKFMALQIIFRTCNTIPSYGLQFSIGIGEIVENINDSSFRPLGSHIIIQLEIKSRDFMVLDIAKT